VSTQWCHGFNGPTGLNYPALFALLDRHELTGDAWWRVFNDIREMEAEALVAMHKET